MGGLMVAQRNGNSKLVDIYYKLSASGPSTAWPIKSGRRKVGGGRIPKSADASAVVLTH